MINDKNCKRLNLRFNLCNEDHKNLLNNIKTIAAEKNKSLNATIIDLLLSKFVSNESDNNADYISDQIKIVFAEELDPRIDALKAYIRSCKPSPVASTSSEAYETDPSTEERGNIPDTAIDFLNDLRT